MKSKESKAADDAVKDEIASSFIGECINLSYVMHYLHSYSYIIGRFSLNWLKTPLFFALLDSPAATLWA